MNMAKTFLYVAYIEQQKIGPHCYIISFSQMSIFNELVIKNDPVKKATSFFIFVEVVCICCIY